MPQNFNAFDLLIPAERPYDYDDFVQARYEWEASFESLSTDKKPTIHELEEFFSQPPYQFSTIFHTLKLKYRALAVQPTTIEQTMSPYQLYASNSPLWARELTAEEADVVLKHTVGTCKLTEEEFNDRYQKAIAGELTKKPLDLRLFW